MNRHALDPISLVFGLAFTALGLLYLAGPVRPAVLGWALPLLAIGLAIGLAFTARRSAQQTVQAVPLPDPDPPLSTPQLADPPDAP
jgi:apolipoprotein N-acyltransferase